MGIRSRLILSLGERMLPHQDDSEEHQDASERHEDKDDLEIWRTRSALGMKGEGEV